MADRAPLSARGRAPSNSPIAAPFLHHHNTPANSVQLFGLLTLIITGGVLLLFTGLTVTAAILALVLFSPLIILTSPIWLPIGALLLFTLVGFICMCACGAAVAATAAWVYKYLRGMQPIESGRVDYARSQIASTATHVKDYAGGYLHTKLKDAAPGA